MIPQINFTTHIGEIIVGDKLQKALNKVGDDWEQLGYNIREENYYAPHVSEETKEANLQCHIIRASEIRRGEIKSLTIWQRVNKELTGLCIPLL